MDSRKNSRFFIAKIKKSWFFKVGAEGFSKVFGLLSTIVLRAKVNINKISLLIKIPETYINIENLYLKIATLLKLNILINMRNKISIQAKMSQIIKQYQTILLRSFNIISRLLLVLQLLPIIRIKTRLVANPIVGQYTKLAQVDPMLLADIDSKTLEQTEAVIL